MQRIEVASTKPEASDLLSQPPVHLRIAAAQASAWVSSLIVPKIQGLKPVLLKVRADAQTVANYWFARHHIGHEQNQLALDQRRAS